MANKNPGDWRQHGKKSPAAAAAPVAPTGTGGGKRGWQSQDEPTAGPKKPWSRISKLFAALGTLGVLSGLVFALIRLLLAPSPATFVCLGSNYYDNLVLPHNFHGWNGLAELSAVSGGGNFTRGGRPSIQAPKELAGKATEAWEKAWGDASRGFNEETIVVFLAMHGATNGKDVFFHVNGNSKDVAPEMDRLPLNTVLQSLGKLEAEKKKKVVLIVEPALNAFNWPSGMIRNDFVRMLKDAHAKIKADHPNLVILCACDADQTSWVSDEWRTTIFSHYVVEGLKGAADGAIYENRIVTARELFVYVEKKVREWALESRAVDQTPIFLGDPEAADKMTLSQIETKYDERDPKTAPGLNWAFPDELKEAWSACKSLDEMVPHPAAYAPNAWRRYRETLLRMEQASRFGGCPEETKNLNGHLFQLRKDIEGLARFDKGLGCLARSLPLTAAFGIQSRSADRDKERARELDALLAGLWSASKDDQLNRMNKLSERAKEAGMNPPLVRADLHRAFLKFLCGGRVGDEIDKSKAQTILELIETKFPGGRSAETHFLAMLLKYMSPEVPPPI